MMETPLVEVPILLSNPGPSPEGLRGLHLQRLERLVRLRYQHELDLNKQGLRLLDRSVFAAYCDCRDAGGEEDARGILHEAALSAPRARGQLPLINAERRPQPSSSAVLPEV